MASQDPEAIRILSRPVKSPVASDVEGDWEEQEGSVSMEEDEPNSALDPTLPKRPLTYSSWAM